MSGMVSSETSLLFSPSSPVSESAFAWLPSSSEALLPVSPSSPVFESAFTWLPSTSEALLPVSPSSPVFESAFTWLPHSSALLPVSASSPVSESTFTSTGSLGVRGRCLARLPRLVFRSFLRRPSCSPEASAGLRGTSPVSANNSASSAAMVPGCCAVGAGVGMATGQGIGTKITWVLEMSRCMAS
eukprot:CAMPEP_0179031382 /NCGR_PEP_ID=MMETSP0796-20121207/11041_1 /TAXON_ID=73915 /ORGANISM="Pyrodinium bahamense, Strain pbaha01" /LENGTH=185 /DNA_ID=CAMNT_0020727571 /DNA_START=365 /DNA_END=922 /DNA_ORIENTATION=+